MNPQAIAAALHRGRALDLSASTLQALCILSKGEQTMTSLAREMEVDPANITGIGDRLESLRFARRIFGRPDRRKVRLAITDHGREALADIIRDATAASWDFTATF